HDAFAEKAGANEGGFLRRAVIKPVDDVDADHDQDDRDDQPEDQLTDEKPRHCRSPYSRSARADRLEFANLIRQRPLDRQSLHRGGAVEAMAVPGVLHDEIGIGRLGDRAAMREHEDIRIDAQGRSGPGADLFRAVFQLQSSVRADSSAGGEAEMADDDIGPGNGHRGGLLLAEHIGRGQHVLLMRLGDHVDLQRIGHAGFLQIGAEDAVDQPDGREALHAGEAERLQLIEEHIHVAEGIGAIDAGEHRRPGHDRQHLCRHLHHDGVGIAVSHEAGERAASGHAIAAGIVDDDKVHAAVLFAFGRQPRAGAAADDRLAAGDHVVKSFQELSAFEPGHGYLVALRRAPARPSRARKALTIVAANSGSLMLCLVRMSWRLLVWRTVRSSAPNSAASASGSQNGWPGASSAETPPSGRKKRTGPSIWLSRSPIHRPIRSFSSGVVRINVTCGLWTWNLRLAKRSGMVSGAPKLTMSSAPAEPT